MPRKLFLRSRSHSPPEFFGLFNICYNKNRWKNGKQCKSKQKYEYMYINNILLYMLCVMPVLCTLSLSLSLSLWMLASYHALLVKNCDCKHQWFWIVVWMRERYLHTFTNGERERIKKTLGKQNHKTKLDRSGMEEKAGRRNREKKLRGQTICSTPATVTATIRAGIQWPMAICEQRILI